jgi:hypothetical protein
VTGIPPFPATTAPVISSVFCADIGDLNRGVTMTQLLAQPSGGYAAGTYPGPITVISSTQIEQVITAVQTTDSTNPKIQNFVPPGTPRSNYRIKAMAHADFSNPPDGLDDLVLLVRDDNNPENGGFNEPGSGFGQLILFEQDRFTGGFKPGRLLLPRSLFLGVVGQNTVDQQPGDFRVKDTDQSGHPDVLVTAPNENAVFAFGYDAKAAPGTIALVSSATISVNVPGQFLQTADFGDVNGDGVEDVVVLTNDGVSNATVLVYLADGKGGFSPTPSHTITIPRNVQFLRCVNVTAPTDHDSFDDIIVADSVSTKVSVFVSSPASSSGFLEDKNGNPIEQAFATGNNGVRHLVLGDVNGDGFLDAVATTNGSTAAIFLTSVPSLFREPVTVAVQDPALTIASTGSALEQVVTIDTVTKDLIVLGPDAALTMSPQKFGPFRAQQRVIAIDSKGTGTKDAYMHLVPSTDGLTILGVAIVKENSTDLLSARPSVTGTFLDPITIVNTAAQTGKMPAGVTSISPTTNFLNTLGAGSFTGGANASSTVGTTTITLSGGTVFVFFEQALGLGGEVGFPAVVSHELGLAYGDVGRGFNCNEQGTSILSPAQPTSAPLTAAGLQDIIVSPVATNFAGDAGIFVIYGDTSVAPGGFSKAQQILGPPARPGVISASNAPSVKGTFNNSSGGFDNIQLANFTNVTPAVLSIVAGVLQDTNPPDPTGVAQNGLVVLDQDTNGVGLMPRFNFNPGSSPNGLPFVAMFLGIADFNQDGFLDMAISSNLGPTCNILLNKGTAGFFVNNGVNTATFQSPLQLRAQPRPWEVTIGDFSLAHLNNPKIPPRDIAMATNSGVIDVYTTTGNGTFSLQRPLVAGGEPNNITTADVNGDGRPDLISTDLGAGSVTVFLHK